MGLDATIDGLTLFRASRLEALVAPLQEMLAKTAPEAVLAPQTVIAAHAGMKQWLVGALARHVGAGGIVANLDVVLPSTWLDGLSSALLGERAVALPQYRRAHLRWSVHAMLGSPQEHGIVDARVLGYLRGGGVEERAVRRFQLADRVAQVLSQYLVYRGDWLQAWEAGKGRFATAARGDAALQALEGEFLAPSWQALARAHGEHRGRLVGALVAALQCPSTPLPPLHLFGIAHLPPGELAVLRAYAANAPVLLYVPDPCREYWGGLVSTASDGRRLPLDADGWAAFRASESTAVAGEELPSDTHQGHPLLARWGRLGQHFFAALADGEIRQDTRHAQDELDQPPTDRLARLQESVRRLEPRLMAEDPAAPGARADASLRSHACHTRLRELEVLRDALLDALADGIEPGAMVVMAPDIQAYLPLIPAVFGAAGSTREGRLPYHLADVPVGRTHRLFALLQALLAMPGSRLSAPEVVDLLAVPELQRTLGLDADLLDALTGWLRSSGAAWAMDGGHKSALGLPARPEHSFAWALDRMLAGYLMGASGTGGQEGEDAAVALADGTLMLPVGGIDGPSAAAIGALDRLLRELHLWRALGTEEHAATAWARLLRTRVDALVAIDPTDKTAVAALVAIHRALAQLAAEPATNGHDPMLRFAVVRDILLDALAAAPERQRFLMGGITFCGMVPQRAIPFDVVCVLGLEEGAFPRRARDGGIDLMATLRRVGDRDVASDDRYLFLETLMSARRRVHLSWVGQGVRDGKPRNPASPLAELLAELELQAAPLVAARRADADADNETTAEPWGDRPWLVRHPLQPFDVRYFDGRDPAMFSHSEAFAGMHGEGSGRLPRLRDGQPLPDPPDIASGRVPLATLAGFFRDPARALLRDRWQVSLDALDQSAGLPEAEPLAGVAALQNIPRRVFADVVLPGLAADADFRWAGEPPAWVALGGVLPIGREGERAWEPIAACVSALAAAARSCGHFATGQDAEVQTVQVDIAVDVDRPDGDMAAADTRIIGSIGDVHPLAGDAGGWHIVATYPGSKGALKNADDLGLRERVHAFLHWALLRLHNADAAPVVPVRVTALCNGVWELAAAINKWDAEYVAAPGAEQRILMEDLRRRLRGLVEVWRAAGRGEVCYYPRAASAALAANSDQPQAVARAVQQAWAGAFTIGERDYAPGYARLLEGELVIGDPESDQDGASLQSLLDTARRLESLLQLEPAGARPGIGTSPPRRRKKEASA